MTKDEALQMCIEYIETDAHERKHVRHAIQEALAQPPLPVQEPAFKWRSVSQEMPTENSHILFCFGVHIVEGSFTTTGWASFAYGTAQPDFWAYFPPPPHHKRNQALYTAPLPVQPVQEQRYDQWLHVATKLLDRLAQDAAQRLRSLSSTSEPVPGLKNRVMVTEESMKDNRQFVDVTFPRRLEEARKLVQQFKEALAQPVQEPVARVTGVYGGRFTYKPINRAMVLPVGMALYSSPQGNT